MSNEMQETNEHIKFVDNSKALSSLLTKYDLYINESDTFDWDDLSNLHINQVEIDRLVYVLGVKSEHKVIVPVDRHHRCSRYYKCQGCNHFRLHFHKEGLCYEIITKKSRKHDHYCSSSSKILTKGMHVLEESQYVIDLIKNSNFANMNKSDRENTLLMSHIGLKPHEICKTTVNRTIIKMKKKFITEIPTYYHMLREYLSKYKDTYPTSTTVLQADTNNCFYRNFISIPDAVEVFENTCIPIYFIDGMFYKSGHYDGVIIQLSGKNGNGGIIQLCAAWLPCEDTLNYVFFLAVMQSMKFDIINVPFMSDRGHLIPAARYMERNFNVVISIKFCVEHIIRNVVQKFNIDKERLQELRTCVNKLQEASTFEGFQQQSSYVTQFDPEIGPLILLYLLKIHPYHWTTFANRHDIKDSKWNQYYEDMIKELFIKTKTLTEEEVMTFDAATCYFGNINKGKKFKMHGISRNNVAESVANNAKRANVRSTIPPISIALWIQQSLIMAQTYLVQIDGLVNNDVPYTSIAIRSLEISKEKSNDMKVHNMESFANIITILVREKRKGKSMTRKVTLMDKCYVKCTCGFNNQYDISCAHIITSMQYLKHIGELAAAEHLCIVKSFVPQYMNTNDIIKAAQRWNHNVILNSDFYKVVAKYDIRTIVEPPPAYKTTTLSGRKRRIRSQGEITPGAYSTETKQHIPKGKKCTFGGSKTKVKNYSNKELKYYGLLSHYGWFEINHVTNDDDVADPFKINCIRDDLKQMQYSKKECSYCKGKVSTAFSHNIRTCTNTDLLGKSSFQSWEEGEFKLLYLGCNEINNFMTIYQNIFDRKEENNDRPNIAINNITIDHINERNEEEINDDDNLIPNNNYDKDPINVATTDANIEQYAIKDNDSPCIIAPASLHQKSPTYDTIPFINWGINRNGNLQKIYNTCAMDSLLFIFGHLYKKDAEINGIVNVNENKLRKILHLVFNGESNEARVSMVSFNDIYRNALDENMPIDLYSAIGDWMPIFGDLCQYNVHSEMYCTKCNINVKNTRRMFAIYVNRITTTLEIDVTKKMDIQNNRRCKQIDVNIETEINMEPVYDEKCDGTLVTQDAIGVTPKVLVIIGSYTKGNNTMFTEVNRNIVIRLQTYNLVGIITNNCVHFRAMINVNDTDWILYDGLKKIMNILIYRNVLNAK